MATKKAKKISKKTVATAPKSTTTTVVTKDIPAKKANFFKKANAIKDIDGIFSAKTLSLLFVELIGAMLLTLAYATLIGNAGYFLIGMILIGIALALSGFAVLFFNPIFTFGAWISHKISTKKMVLVAIAQVLGTMLAVILLTQYLQAADTTNTQASLGGTTPSIFKLPALASGKEWFVFFGEFLGATLISFMVAQAWKRSATEKAVVVGTSTFAVLFLMSMLVGNIKSLPVANPAMSIAIVDFAKETWQWNAVVYVIAPLLGGVLGFLLDKVLVRDSGVKTTVKTA